MLRIRIRDRGLGAYLTPGSGIRDWRKSASGSGIRDEQPGSYLLELINHFLLFGGLKYLNSLMRIRDPVWRQFGSGIRYGQKVGSTLHWYTSGPIAEMECFLVIMIKCLYFLTFFLTVFIESKKRLFLQGVGYWKVEIVR